MIIKRVVDQYRLESGCRVRIDGERFIRITKTITWFGVANSYADVINSLVSYSSNSKSRNRCCTKELLRKIFSNVVL